MERKTISTLITKAKNYEFIMWILEIEEEKSFCVYMGNHFGLNLIEN